MYCKSNHFQAFTMCAQMARWDLTKKTWVWNSKGGVGYLGIFIFPFLPLPSLYIDSSRPASISHMVVVSSLVPRPEKEGPGNWAR